MRKEVEKMKRYGLIGLMLLVILATPAMAQAPQPNPGPTNYSDIGIHFLKIDDDDGKVTYGETVKIIANYDVPDPNIYGTRYVGIYEWTKYNSTLNNTNVTKLLDPDNYKWLGTLPATGSHTFEINTAAQGIRAGTYVVTAFNGTIAVWDRYLVLRVEPIAGKPDVSISATPMTVALGDQVELKYSMSGSDQYYVMVFLTGWSKDGTPNLYIANCTGKSWEWVDPSNSTMVGGKLITLQRFYRNFGPYSTFDEGVCGLKLFDLTTTKNFTRDTEGYIVAKIVAMSVGGYDLNYSLGSPHVYLDTKWQNWATNFISGTDPTKAEAVQAIIVAKPTLSSISVPSKHVRGTDLTITGVTNVAESGSKYDAGAQNIVVLNITDLNDVPKVNATAIVGKDKTFSIKIDNLGTTYPSGGLPTGYYKAKFTLITDTGFTDEETTVFELVNGMVKISPDKTTVIRGDKVKFTIITNLKINSPVEFTIEDQKIIGGTGSATETLRVDATGKAYKEITVAQTAPLTEYKFKAKIAGDITDTVTISVVKQTIDLSADKTTVARGGEIRFTGSTTADRVYIFASEENIFKYGGNYVPDVFTETNKSIDPSWIYAIPDTNDKLDFKIEVPTDVDAGTYYLYFYANVTPGYIDRASDPQKMFAIVVTDPRIISVEIPSVIPYQGEVEVKIVTDPGKREKAAVTWVLEGSNVKAKPRNFGGPADGKYTIDSNNEVSFRLNLKNYYDEKNRALDAGLYVFTVKLLLDNDEVDKVQKLVEISTIKMDVTIEPATIVVGDTIKVTVQTDREGVAGYDNIWVTMVGANYKAVQKVTLDANGKGSVTFESVGIADGTYKFYIRDTMGTTADDLGYTANYIAEELYDLDPADSTARMAKAHDDLLVIKTVQILKEKPTVTTPVPTTPVPTTPVATPTPPPTTPVTTPAKTPTPTTPAPGPIPGFEAIFAIAGLIAVAYLLRRRQ
ncbi:MAG: PGF-CTERM sorting domain-containing protein [Archaeoglobaceae archaeon]|nr:PGF-CTERM sorting domain-containing protein [Archaeoglobaceae archaeon]MDW8118677.1 PGF-CTERM sorting domain-containing protein [Archaeoglobaceae archaeon]